MFVENLAHEPESRLVFPIKQKYLQRKSAVRTCDVFLINIL